MVLILILNSQDPGKLSQYIDVATGWMTGVGFLAGAESFLYVTSRHSPLLHMPQE
jgi:hypothetical protein